MATKTFYLKDAAASGGSGCGSLADGVAPANATTTTAMATGGLAPAGDPFIFGSTVTPASTIDSNPNPPPGTDSFRSENTLSGTFATGNWTFQIGVARSVGTIGGVNTMHCNVRVYRSPDPTGATGATEITVSPAATTSINPTSTTSTSPNLGAATFTNEYLFVQYSWELEIASAGANTDALQVGATLSFVTTTDFTPAAAPTPSFWRSSSPKGPSHGKRGASGSPISRFRSPQAFVPGPDQAPPGSATFWTSRGPKRAFGKNGPWARFRPPKPYLAPADGASATVGAAPGSANFTFPTGKATGAALVGASPGSANYSAPTGKATGAARAAASSGAANFSWANGKATGAALAKATAGSASFSNPLGKATGSASVGALAALATFSAPAGKATGAAVVATSAATAVFSRPLGRAGVPAAVGALAAALAASFPAGSASGAANVGATPGLATFSSAPGRASVPTPATVGASPGISTFSVAPGAASQQQAGGGAEDRPPFARSYLQPAPQQQPLPVFHIPATVGAEAGVAHVEAAPGCATGKIVIPATVRIRPGRTRVRASHGSAIGKHVIPATVGASAGVAEIIPITRPARGAAFVGAAAAADIRSDAAAGSARGYHNLTDEELAWMLFEATRRAA